MNELISVQLILSLAGCVGIVIATTQLIKKYIKTDPKIIALIVSILIGIARTIAIGKYDMISILIGLLNIIPILWGAIGGYDTMLKPKMCGKSEETPENPIEKTTEEITMEDDTKEK